MTITVYNSKDIKYIWSTSDDDALVSLTSVFDNGIIYVVECAYDNDTTEMEYSFYKSTDTDNNEKLWDQLMVDDLENWDKCFKEVTDEEDIEYIKHKESVYSVFTSDMCHNLSHDTLRSMIIGLYTNITNKDISDDTLNCIYSDVISMLSSEQDREPLTEKSLEFIRKYAKESLFEPPLMMYQQNQYRNLVSDIIQHIKEVYA